MKTTIASEMLLGQQLSQERFRSNAWNSHSNSPSYRRKGLVIEVPGPKCNECSGTLSALVGLSSLLVRESAPIFQVDKVQAYFLATRSR